jgi:pheromone shutdown-related protein TraB
MKVQAALLTSLFSDEKLSEEDLQKLQQRDTLSLLLDEMRGVLPSVKTVLVDERDALMAQRLRNAEGSRVVAVVGAAHVPGICQCIQQDTPPEILAAYDIVPPKSTLSKCIPWLIPAVVVLLFVCGFLFGKTDVLQGAAMAWVLANGMLSALGAVLAWGHPLTIVTAFVAAPITSLNPTIGAGMVTGLVQAWIAPPTVGDMERVGEDLTHMAGWWRNRVARVLLVFFFSSLGSAIGTFVAFHWLKDLL